MKPPRPRSNKLAPGATANASLSVGSIVLEFTHQLTQAAELAAMERGRYIIDTIFAQVANRGQALLSSATTKQANRVRDRAITALTRNFLEALEAPMHARVQAKVDRELAHAERTAAREKPGQTNFPFAASAAALPARRKVRRARPPVHLPPPLDPEQIKRDQEFARLRALLKPVAVEVVAPTPAPVFVAPAPVQTQRPASPGDVLRALEKEIQNAVPTLGTLGPQRCGAQIAAWAGQVRGLRDRLPADISATMRPAFRIFLEHLTQLREQMEAHMVDALEPNWKAPDWDAYVEINRANAEKRAPELSTDRQHNYHRTMLRTLVLPHRKSVPGQAAAIINAAAESLHPEDSLLQSAIRRHRSTMATATPAPAANEEATLSVAGNVPSARTMDTVPAEAVPARPADLPEVAPAAPPAPQFPENEFDSTWTK